MFTWPAWMERVAAMFRRVPTWARYTAAGIALFLLGAVLL